MPTTRWFIHHYTSDELLVGGLMRAVIALLCCAAMLGAFATGDEDLACAVYLCLGFVLAWKTKAVHEYGGDGPGEGGKVLYMFCSFFWGPFQSLLAVPVLAIGAVLLGPFWLWSRL